MKYIVPTMALFSLAIFGCTGSGDTTTTSGALESCFATSGGQMRCVATPGGVTKGARDVDGDGTPDTFVCSNNEEGSHCDCAKLGCRDLRPRSEGAGGHGACDGGRAFGDRDGGDSFDRGGAGGRTETGDRSGGGDMVCPPSATGAGGSGAAGAPGAGGAPGSAGATGGTIG